MRASLGAVAIINFFNLMFSALFLLYAVRELHISPGLIGVVLGAAAVGGVIGAAVHQAHRRPHRRRAGVRARLLACSPRPSCSFRWPADRSR